MITTAFDSKSLLKPFDKLVNVVGKYHSQLPQTATESQASLIPDLTVADLFTQPIVVRNKPSTPGEEMNRTLNKQNLFGLIYLKKVFNAIVDRVSALIKPKFEAIATRAFLEKLKSSTLEVLKPEIQYCNAVNGNYPIAVNGSLNKDQSFTLVFMYDPYANKEKMSFSQLKFIAKDPETQQLVDLSIDLTKPENIELCQEFDSRGIKCTVASKLALRF